MPTFLVGVQKVGKIGREKKSTVLNLWTSMGYGPYHQLLNKKPRKMCVCSNEGKTAILANKYFF